MSKAEEKALKVYPAERGHMHDRPYQRESFIKGYEQAGQDLALTTEDIRLIIKIHYEIVFKDTTGIKVGDVASEVLRRFREYKNQ